MAGTSLELPASDPYATHLAEWRNVELPRWQTEIEQWEAGDRAHPAPKPRPPPCDGEMQMSAAQPGRSTITAPPASRKAEAGGPQRGLGVSCRRRRERSWRGLCERSREVRAHRGKARRSGYRTTTTFDREGHASPSLSVGATGPQRLGRSCERPEGPTSESCFLGWVLGLGCAWVGFVGLGCLPNRPREIGC